MQRHPSLSPGLQGTRSGGASSTSSTGDSKLLLWIGTEKTTPFAPSLLERMARAKTLQAQWTKMIERVRYMAQTNPNFRGERLVASAVNALSDRVQFAVALKDASLACFDNIKPLGEFMTEISNAHQAIAGYHDVLLRQVMLFTVKPLKEYVTVHYPRIVGAYQELEKRRDRYDDARRKKSPQMINLQQQLCEHAGVLEGLLNQIAEHQLTGAKAIDVMVRAEKQFMKETQGIIKEVRGPDNKKRWSKT